jgi:hypothetical protein
MSSPHAVRESVIIVDPKVTNLGGALGMGL